VIPEGQGLNRPMSNRLPTGPGSRGGQWHDPEYRRIYYRAWRAAHPEYRKREVLRIQRKRKEYDPVPPVGAVPREPMAPAVSCGCTECDCPSEVPTVCGFCRQGLHEGDQ
jgi:hypothetical protein